MKRASDYPISSQCPKGGLHDYWHTAGDDMTYREECHKCGHHLIWAVGVGGQSAKWFAAHARDGLQPYGEDREMFIAEYGRERYDEIYIGHKSQDTASMDDIIGEAKEDLKSEKKKTFI